MPSSALSGISHIPILGRERQLAAIEGAWAAARAGAVRVILLTGEPGIGKSRLVSEALAQPAFSGALVLRGQALEGQGMPPYFALRAPVAALLQAAGDAPEIAELRPVLAGAGIIRAAGSLPTPLDADAERLRLFDTLAELFLLACTRQPVVLALDDIQWAAPVAWDVILYLARVATGAPLLIVLGLREEALREGRGPIASAVAELSRLRVLAHLPLSPLENDDIAAFAAAALHGPALPPLVAMLRGRSGGNPFFIEELLLALAEQDSLIRRDDGWDLRHEADGVQSGQIPVTLELAISARLDRLPSETIEALEAAAVLSNVSGPRALASMLGWSADRTERALQPAVVAGLVDVVQGGGWAFRHDTVREAVYQRAAGERGRLHAAAARAVADERGLSPSLETLAALAYHWQRADQPREAAESALAASNAATAAHAVAEALGYARTASAMADRCTGDGRAARIRQTRAALGAAAIAAGEYHEAERALRDALAAAGDNPRERATIQAQLGLLFRRRELPSESTSWLLDALGGLGGTEHDDPQVVEVLIELTTVEGTTQARYAQAETHGEAALAMAERLGDRGLEARAALALANTLARSQDPVAARPLLERSLAGALASGDVALAAEVSASLANSYYWTGDLTRSREHAERRLELAERGADIFGLRHAHSWLALLAYSRGDFDEARRLLATAEPALARLASPEPIAFLRLIESLVALRTGELELAYARVREALDLFQSVDPATAVWYAGVLTWIALATGRIDGARREVAAQEQRLAGLADSALPARSARVALAFAYAELGDHEGGARCEAALAPYAGDFHWTPARRALAALSELRGDGAAALEQLAAAEAQARREGMRPDLVLILEARARLAQQAEPAAEARQLRTALGMPDPGAAAPPPRPAHPAGLSPREVEVLQLVARGLSNREIAARLVLSERTVINHISHIFAKVGCENRAGATAYAFQNGLA